MFSTTIKWYDPKLWISYYSESKHYDPTMWKEFITALNNLKSDLSPGLNRIPAKAFKAMDSDNRKKIFNYVVDFWNGNIDYNEWHKGQGVPSQENKSCQTKQI